MEALVEVTTEREREKRSQMPSKTFQLRIVSVMSVLLVEDLSHSGEAVVYMARRELENRAGLILYCRIWHP